MAVSYIGKGAFTSGTGAITPGISSATVFGDFCLLFVETANEAVSLSSEGIIDWTEVSSSPVSTTHGSGAAEDVRLTVFYGWYLGGTRTGPTIADSGNHTSALIVTLRGVNLTTPFDTTPTYSVDDTPTTTLTPTDITTITGEAGIVFGIAIDADAISTNAIEGTLANSNLSNLTVRHEQSNDAGVGGGVGVITANKSSIGAIGATTGGTTVSCTHAYLTMALRAAAKKAKPVVGNEIPYNESTWDEFYIRSGTVSFSADGMSMQTSGAEVATPWIHAKPNTSYGVLLNIVTMTSGNLYVGGGSSILTQAVIGTSAGLKKLTITSAVDFTGKNVAFNMWESSSATVLVKSIRVFELISGSEVASDFSTMTADELDAKYPYVDITLRTAHSNSISVIGEKNTVVNKNGTVAIENSHSVSVTGKAVNRNGSILISNSNEILAAGKKGVKGSATIQHSNSISVTGIKTSENISGGVVSVVNFHSLAAIGRKSSRAPPVSITGTAFVNVTGNSNAEGNVSISHSESVSANGRKAAKASAEIYGASSISGSVRKAAKGTVSINNAQAVLVIGAKITSKTGTVSITGESSIIVTGKKVARKTVSISHTNSVSAAVRKCGKASVIILDQNGVAVGATKSSFAVILISNNTALLVVGIRLSVHKPYEVLFELIERRIDITLEEREAILEVEEWHL